jgi:hypothetical protein
MADGEKIQDFQRVLRDFLEFREWNDELQYDDSLEEWSISTGLGANDESIKAFIEGNDFSGQLGIYMYYESPCKESKVNEVLYLINWLNFRIFVGHFELVNGNVIRWVFKLDCENLDISGFNVSIHFEHGWEIVGRYAELISSVAFTKATAQQAIEEFENSDASDVQDDTPDEL